MRLSMSRTIQAIVALTVGAILVVLVALVICEADCFFSAEMILRETPPEQLFERIARKRCSRQKILERGLTSSNKFVRAKAVWALGEIGDVRSVPKLAMALSDKCTYVQEAAQAALRKMGPRAGMALADMLRSGAMAIDGERFASLLAELRTDSVAASLRELLLNWKLVVRENAALALGLMRDTAATSLLITALESDSLDVQIAAARALGELRAVQAVSVLQLSLQKSDKVLKATAVRALGLIGDSSSVDAIAGCLGSSDTAVVRSSLRSLEMLRCSRAVEPLMLMVRSKSSAWRLLRSEVTKAIVVCGVGSGAKLLRYLTDSDIDVRIAALEAAVASRDESLLPALQLSVKGEIYEIRKRAIAALGYYGTSGASILLPLLRDTSVFIRRDAIRALGHTKDRRAADALLQILRCWELKDLNKGEISPLEAQEAMVALGRIGDVRAATFLRRVVSSRVGHAERSHAARALGMLRDTAAVTCLMDAIADSSADTLSCIVGAQRWDVRLAAVQALGAIGDIRSMPALLAALRSRHPDLRREALKALALVDTAECRRALVIAKCDANKDVRQQAEELSAVLK